MKRTPTLSTARQQLVRLVTELNFGRIEGLLIVHGEPQVTPDTRIIQEVKFGSNPQLPKSNQEAERLLKEQWQELFAELDRLPNGRIQELIVQNGLPFRMAIERPAA